MYKFLKVFFFMFMHANYDGENILCYVIIEKKMTLCLNSLRISHAKVILRRKE